MEKKPKKIKLLSLNSSSIRLELWGEDHTLCNLLRNTLFTFDNVEMAGYHIPHPLVSSPVFYLKVKSGDPLSTLKRALEEIEKKAREFQLKATEKIKP